MSATPASASAELSIPPFALNDAMLYVSTVATGSFTAAAERHGITPSGVSRAITRLERTIGVRLLVRTTRRLRMTEEGELFYENCREALALMANAADLASESSTSLKGLLRVGVLSIVGTHFVVPMLPNLLTLHPELSVQLVRVSSGEDFYSQQVDCALLPVNLVDSGLVGRELRPGRMVVVATPEYISRYGAPELPADLLGHRCITLVQSDGQERPWQFRPEATLRSRSTCESAAGSGPTTWSRSWPRRLRGSASPRCRTCRCSRRLPAVGWWC